MTDIDKLDPAYIVQTCSRKHVQSVTEELIEEVRMQRSEVVRLTADRDSWQQQASDRVDDAVQAMAERDAAQRAARHESDLAQQALDDLRSVTTERDALRAELERATAERDEAIRIASAYSPAKELQRSLDQAKASGVEARKERDAAIRERDALRAELDRWHSELTAVMRPDFKDWSSFTERPALAAWIITNQREHYAWAEGVIERLTAERDALRTELEALRAQEPVAWLWQHADTGMTGFVDAWQLENGWAELNRHHQLTTALYTAPQPPREVERLSDCHMKKTITDWYGSIYWAVDYRQVSRAIESACAAAWGLKLKDPT